MPEPLPENYMFSLHGFTFSVVRALLCCSASWLGWRNTSQYMTLRLFDRPDCGALQGPARTSALLAPTMLLTGHAGEVFTAKFSPDGTVVASGSHDKHVFLWRTYGECENYMMLQGAHAPRVSSAAFC